MPEAPKNPPSSREDAPAPGAATASAAAGDTIDAFCARTPWTAGAAAVFGIITIVSAIFWARGLQPLHAGIGAWLGSGRHVNGTDVGLIANSMLTLLVLQAVIIAMVWWGAARFGGDRLSLLSLDRGFTLRTFLTALAGMAALLLPYNILVYSIWPEHFAADLRPFWDMARSPVVWLGAIAVVIGAPISEELLFRGFLLPALSKTRYGFAGGALVATIGWTALHFYSIAGMIEVLAIGLYFSWLMKRNGSLWLPMTLHALYNGGQLAALALWPA